MTDIQRQLVQILGKMLFNKQVEWSDAAADWNALLDEAIKQAVFPIVFEFAKDRMPGGSTRDKYLKYDNLYILNNIRNLYYHNKLHHIMEENEIPYVILKGQVSAGYYPAPMKRPMGDVDFLVEHKNINRVEEILLSLGYEKSKKSDFHEFHWAYTNGKEKLEAHWEVPGVPMGDSVIRSYMKDIINKRVSLNESDKLFYIPSEFHHGAVLLLHTVSHLASSGVGLRHLCDWLVFHNSMSEDEFMEMFSEPLKKMGLWKLAMVMTKIGILYFGCDERKWCERADEQLCNAFLSDIFNGGNFGVKEKSRKSQVMLIQNNQTKEVSNRGLIKNGALSIHKKAIQDYPVCEIVPVLRPFVWAIVLIQYFLKVRAGKKKNVLSWDNLKKAVRRQRIYSKLELYTQNDRDGKGQGSAKVKR